MTPRRAPNKRLHLLGERRVGSGLGDGVTLFLLGDSNMIFVIAGSSLAGWDISVDVSWAVPGIFASLAASQIHRGTLCRVQDDSLTPSHGTDVCFLARITFSMPGPFLRISKVASRAARTSSDRIKHTLSWSPLPCRRPSSVPSAPLVCSLAPDLKGVAQGFNRQNAPLFFTRKKRKREIYLLLLLWFFITFFSSSFSSSSNFKIGDRCQKSRANKQTNKG